MISKILVVDDEENLRFSFRRLLANDGYEVSMAGSYSEALERLAETSFDVVFADILLGSKTGIDLLRAINERGLNCPVIMITGAPDIETASEAVRLGAFDYVSKPVLKDTLLHNAKMACRYKRLLEEKENYRLNLGAIFRSVDYGIVSVNEQMEIVEVNSAMLNICGYSRVDAIGRTFEALRLDCNKRCLKLLSETIEKKEARENFRFECNRMVRFSQVVTVKTLPLTNENNNFSGAVMVVKDETRIDKLEREMKDRRQFHKIIGASASMQKVFSLIEDLSDVDSTVLILGESGTGKELVAGALHQLGARSENPFVTVNCSALSEGLLGSELFGHVKGAFTGAVEDKVGRFEKANGGTIFLDEIGDISPGMQLRLLRVLQEREFERVGGSKPVKVDVRVVAATNRNLAEKIKTGEFREDLYYRLKVVELNLPPLRERLEDIPLLTDHFIREFNRKFDKNIKAVSDEVHSLFLAYHWPGNIRELKHTLEHAFVVCRQGAITTRHLPPYLSEGIKTKSFSTSVSKADERQFILDALKKHSWNKAKAARMLGFSRLTMYRKIEKYKITPYD